MAQWNSFWKTNLTNGEAVFRQALLSHIITAKHAAPLMIRRRRGLIVEVTENDFLMAGGNPLSQSVKLALKGLALNMAAELRPHGVAAIAITPGSCARRRCSSDSGSPKPIGVMPAKRTRTFWNRNRLCSLVGPSPPWHRTAASSSGQVNSTARGNWDASMVSPTPRVGDRIGGRSRSISRVTLRPYSS